MMARSLGGIRKACSIICSTELFILSSQAMSERFNKSS
jgi:hypothetical protein